jgi:hypothetical protein
MDLVSDLLNDDDENIELWYVMGVAGLSCKPVDVDSSRYHLETARGMMEKLLASMSEVSEGYHGSEKRCATYH